MENIKILEQSDRDIVQSYYKLRHNNNNYTFVDYVYKDSGEPVGSGELCNVFDNNGKLVESQELKDTFGTFVDMMRSCKNIAK